MNDPTQEEGDSSGSSIDLEEAREIWLDPHRIEFAIRTEDEPRYFTIGKLRSGSCITVAYVPMPGNVRLLSARKSLAPEIQFYES